MTVVHLHAGLTSLVDAGITVHHTSVVGVFVPDGTTSDRTNLTTTVEAATQCTAIHLHVGVVHIAVDHITATEGITCQLDGIGLLVVKFLDILVHGGSRCSSIHIAIADITIVDGQVGSTID